MGRKKKTPAPPSKQSPAAPMATAAPSDVAEAEPCEDPETATTISTGILNNQRTQAGAKIEPSVADGSIKHECEKALTSLRRGNYTKALRLMKESCSRHEKSALIHRVQGTVCMKVASIIDDQNAKARHLRSAIDSARKAVELSPNSIEFAHFYANLLYEAANDGTEYEEVVQECQRALAIEIPVDPAKESLQDESQQKISTSEARIVHVQEELRSLIQKSNIALMKNLGNGEEKFRFIPITWMKNFGNGEEKFRFLPIRRIAEDPMESRLLQARRPNEIKKATKTPEERRKEIEVRVAAARLLQEKSEPPQMEKEGKSSDGGPDSSSGIRQRGGERRKNVRQKGSTSERKDWVRSYWDSMSLDMKRDLLKIKVSDFKTHFCSLKDGSGTEAITEALSFYETHKTWKFWVCGRCNEKFVDSEPHMQHVVQDHMGNVLPKMQLVLPQSVDNEWIEMLRNSSWKPLDLSAAVKTLCNQPKCRDFMLCELVFGNTTEDSEECFKDAWDSSSEKENFGDGNNCKIEESNACDRNHNIGLNESNGDQESVALPPPDGWPISDDPECAKLLEKIHAAFELLIRHKCLAVNHLNRVMQFTLDELHNLASGSRLLNCGLDQSPVCICFLGALQLRKILKFLQDLSQSCGLCRYSDKNIPADDDKDSSDGSVLMEEIILDGEGLCLVLDERLLLTECTHKMFPGTATDSLFAADSAYVANGNKAPGANEFLSWIFTGPSTGEQVASWIGAKEERMRQGLETMQVLEKEFCHVQSLCERKSEHLSYEEALQAVEGLCFEEGKMRKTKAELTPQSFESVLRKRREELTESDNDLVFISSRFELDAITNVLKEAEALNVNQFGYEEPCASTTSQLCDLESGEADEWRIKDSLHQVDTLIEVAIQKQREQISAELSKIDAQIMWNVTGMQQLELKLGRVSAYDYQSILLPLIKSYIRAHLEDLAEKDAIEKSNAAREALLAELALDSKKDVRGRNNKSKHMQARSKAKKKNKDNWKAKVSKATGGNEHQFNHGIIKHSSFPVASDGDHSESEVVFENVDDFKQDEEECRRKVELEEEERKLEETLEYQRRIENEAKQNFLAEQQKKFNCSVPSKFAEGGTDVYSCPISDDFGDHKPATHGTQQHWIQKNGVVNNVEGISETTLNGVSLPIKSSAVSGSGKVQHAKAQRAMASEGATEAGALQSDQQTGRRGRRHKGANKTSDGKYQTMPPEKATIEAQSSVVEDCGHHDNMHTNGEIGTKTLRQLQAEEDDDERFQADLKMAVRQSLDAYQAHQKMPSSLRTSQRPALEVKDDGLQCNVVTNEIKNANGTDEFGTGLQNEVGEYNCFLNVIIQSLWHLRRFRVEFLGMSTLKHLHVGDPCVVCALYEIFTALSIASTETRREPVAPTSLRIALSNLYPDGNFFQEAQMNDASEVLAVIFDCLHRAFASSSNVSDTESIESNCIGSWDCTNRTCIVHSLFGMDVFEQMNCYSCGLESRHLKYTSFFHNINASALRTMKVMCAESSFDELLNLVDMNHQLSCDLETGGCGKHNYIHHILSTPPYVFTTVIGWQRARETANDITATLAAINTEIDISVMYRGLDPKKTYSLISVVCYYGQHYHCFAYSHDHERWIMYDDQTVKVIGRWADVLSMCERGHLQPQVLFYQML